MKTLLAHLRYIPRCLHQQWRNLVTEVKTDLQTLKQQSTATLQTAQSAFASIQRTAPNPESRREVLLHAAHNVRDGAMKAGNKFLAGPESATPTYDRMVTTIRHVVMQGPSRLSLALMQVATLLFIFFIGWSSLTTIDEITRGTGKVIPSSELQVIQNLEGGIVEEFLVQEGETVKRGQIIMRLDATTFASQLGESKEKINGLQAQRARLTALAEDSEPIFPTDLIRERPELVNREIALYRSQKENFRNGIEILEQQASQKEQEAAELESRVTFLTRSYNLAIEEMSITQPLVDKGISSRVELIQLQRQATELAQQLESARLNIPILRSTAEEARQRTEEKRAAHRSEILEELRKVNIDLATLNKTINASSARVDRTEIRSPVDGVIKQLFVKTVGGVVQPGNPIAEIVPLEDTMIIEAQIEPKDVADLSIGMAARVKLSAFDYSLYGALDGEVIFISPDAIIDKEGNSFYRIRVRTKDNYSKAKHQTLLIKPGMAADVDIITGRKSIMRYIFKPIVKTMDRALTER